MPKRFQKISGFLLLAFLLGIWEVYSILHPQYVFLPRFSVVIKTLFYNLKDPVYLEDILSTLQRCFLGYFLSIVIMIPLGMLMGRVNKIFFLFEPLVEFFRPMPSAAIIPIAILFLGIDDEMKIFVIFFGSSWPILINTIQGVRSIEQLYIKTGEVFNMKPGQIFIRIIFPASLPSIFSGLRLSIGIALILAITVEMIVSTGGGLGYYILDAERSFHFAEMYAGVLTIGIIGYFVNYLIQLASKRFINEK